MKVTETTLKNGSKIIGIQREDSTSVAIHFGFLVGSRDETPEIAGVSHFLEHMLFKGSKKRPSHETISREMDKIGAQVNAATSQEYTYYHIKTTPDNFDLALDIIGDMVTRPLLDEQELQKEKGTVIQEIHMGSDTPATDIFRRMEEVTFGAKTGLGREVLGSVKTIKAMNSNKMREYYQKNYTGKKTVVVVAGNLPLGYQKKIATYLNRLKPGQKQVREINGFAKKKVLVKHKETSQAHFGITVPAFQLSDSKQYVAEIITTIIAGMGMMSNRLFIEIREKRGWAYRIWGYNDVSYNSGYIGIFGGLKLEKVEPALKIIKSELLNFSKTVTDEEIERAKGYLSGSIPLKMDDNDELATFALLNEFFSGDKKLPKDVIKAINKVTRKEIIEVANELFQKEKIYFALIGPFKDEEKFAKILQR